MMLMARRGAWVTLLAIVAGCAGSGPRPMRVSGAVSFEDKPVEKGTVTFTPTGTTPGGSVAAPIEGGLYDLPARDGPISGGTYRVEINAVRKTGRTMPNIVDPGNPPLEETENYIPAAYNAKSHLEVTISPSSSENRHDFALASVKGQGGPASGKR